jgi:gamma-glutamylaminecyclotransferase
MVPVPAGHTLVFVYGTLKRGCSNHAFIARQHFIAATRTAAVYRLHSLGCYPGMVRAEAQAGSSIPGELWAVDAACLAQLDVLEGIAEGEYERAIAQLAAPHEHWEALVYLYRASVARWPVIAEWREAGMADAP